MDKPELLKNCALWFVDTMTPYNAATSEYWKKLFVALNPSAETFTPSPRALKTEVNRLAEELRQKLKQTLAGKSIVVGADVWSARSRKSFLGITAYWIDDDEGGPRRSVACLALVPIESHTAENVFQAITKTIQEYDVHPTAFVADNENTMLSVGRKLSEDWDMTHARCLAHLIDLAGKQIAEDPGFAGALRFLQDVVDWWRKNYHRMKKTTSTLQNDERKFPGSPKASSATRWLSRYDQLEWFLDPESRGIFEKVLNRDSVHMYVEDADARKDYPPLFSDAQDSSHLWALHQLYLILTPLHRLVKLIQVESSPVFSAAWGKLVKWFNAWGLLTAFKPDGEVQDNRRRNNPERRPPKTERSSSGRIRQRNTRLASYVVDADALGNATVLGSVEAPDQTDPLDSMDKETRQVTMSVFDLPPGDPVDDQDRENWAHAVRAGAMKIWKHYWKILTLAEDSVAAAIALHPSVLPKEELEALPETWKAHFEARLEAGFNLMEQRLALSLVAATNLNEADIPEHARQLREHFQDFVSSARGKLDHEGLLDFWGDVRYNHTDRDLRRQLEKAWQECVMPVLNYPASSSTVERLFSQCGLVDIPSRSRLADDQLCDIVYLKFNEKHK